MHKIHVELFHLKVVLWAVREEGVPGSRRDHCCRGRSDIEASGLAADLLPILAPEMLDLF